MKRATFLVTLVPLVLFVAAGVALAATPTPGAPHDALHAVGPQSAHIVDLWRVFVWTCAIVFGLILAVLLAALWHGPRATELAPADLSSTIAPEPRPTRRVTLAVAGCSVLLVLLIVASVFTDRALAHLSLRDAVNLEVTGHQWWWTVKYLSKDSVSQIVETANEIHVPVGRPVVVTLKSDDVIHSLWMPNLAGKRDLIPGRTAQLTFQADKPGPYRGQCAEFCGYEHALMALLVVADPPEQYEAWLQAQRHPAPEPTDTLAQRGKVLFQSTSCAMCHTVQGTLAQGKHAPDLTHVASRQTLAAGTLPNTREALSQWIADPQKYKPGTNMPATPLSPQDLQAIVAYLGGLR
ncbi:cytochrome c oxidase subunit II [Ramlibacter sp. MMS24-I3-19]|uniref:cytochrome c oxidase subunit II n=1 Tax=Ramlibacter sp. MMS24-I3-19 TaxID=3416606 RepID=UPI003D053E9C